MYPQVVTSSPMIHALQPLFYMIIRYLYIRCHAVSHSMPIQFISRNSLNRCGSCSLGCSASQTLIDGAHSIAALTTTAARKAIIFQQCEQAGNLWLTATTPILSHFHGAVFTALFRTNINRSAGMFIPTAYQRWQPLIVDMLNLSSRPPNGLYRIAFEEKA